MRSLNFFFILVLLTINYSNTFDFASFVQLNDLQTDSYAKSLIETIQMSIRNTQGGGIESIQTLLEDLLTKLINDQKNADSAWAKEKSRLDGKISDLQNEIARLKEEISRLTKEKIENEAKRDQSIKNIAQYSSQKTQDQASLIEISSRRSKDRASYEASVKEHAAIIGAIDEVIGALAKLRGSVSGIGKPAHVGAIANETRDANWKAGVKKSFLEIVGDEDEAQAFVEMATEADQNALEKLIALLNDIQRNTKKSLADDESSENQSVASFNKLKASLESDIASLENLLKRQTANLDGYIKRINDLILTLNIRNSLLSSREVELKITIQERATKLNQYNLDTAHRSQENTTIRRIQKIVKERLATMSKYLRSNVNK